MSCLETTSVRVYGNLTPELHEKMTPMGALFFKPHSGAFDRTFAAENAVPD